MARKLLENGSSVAVGMLQWTTSDRMLTELPTDNTNRDREARAHWVKVAREFKIPIRCILFTASARLCEHNDMVRAHNSDVSTLGGLSGTCYTRQLTDRKS